MESKKYKKKPSSIGESNSPLSEGCHQPAADDGVVKRASKNYFNLPFNPKLKQRARELRKAGNLPEVVFWNRVKSKQFKGFDFDRQKIIGNYIVDFYCANCQVVIEIDGRSHNHKIDYDSARDVYLESLGLTVIHLSARRVLQEMNEVMDFLYDHTALAKTPPEDGS